MFETWTNYKLIDDTNQTVVFDAPKMLELLFQTIHQLLTISWKNLSTKL